MRGGVINIVVFCVYRVCVLIFLVSQEKVPLIYCYQMILLYKKSNDDPAFCCSRYMLLPRKISGHIFDSKTTTPSVPKYMSSICPNSDVMEDKYFKTEGVLS